jgi:acetyl esterase/lipase
MYPFRPALIALLALLLAAVLPCAAQETALSPAAAWAGAVGSEYTVTSNVVYLTANNFDLKLDIYAPLGLTRPNPTLIYFHGGGWVIGSKETAVLHLLPYLEMGWTVVNVQYRLGRVSLAPAAVEDCRCALRWVIRNAERYRFDVNRIVLTGHSAGGHLSLITAMLTSSVGLDRQCPTSFGTPPDPAKDEPRVAAVVNWYGISDVNDLLEGPNTQGYALSWFGSLTNREEIARRVSPLQYVRPGLPPVITIHGDQDTVVPYAHATRLHAELQRHGVPNQLVTIPGGKHGGFTRAELEKAYSAIRAFLARHGLGPAAR